MTGEKSKQDLQNQDAAPQRHPGHDWGALAADPWLEIGARGPAYREVMRRIWLRQGGSEDMFEQLLPAEQVPPVQRG